MLLRHFVNKAHISPHHSIYVVVFSLIRALRAVRNSNKEEREFFDHSIRVMSKVNFDSAYRKYVVTYKRWIRLPRGRVVRVPETVRLKPLNCVYVCRGAESVKELNEINGLPAKERSITDGRSRKCKPYC